MGLAIKWHELDTVRSKYTLTPINGTLFSTPLRGISTFTK